MPTMVDNIYSTMIFVDNLVDNNIIDSDTNSQRLRALHKAGSPPQLTLFLVLLRHTGEGMNVALAFTVFLAFNGEFSSSHSAILLFCFSFICQEILKRSRNADFCENPDRENYHPRGL